MVAPISPAIRPVEKVPKTLKNSDDCEKFPMLTDLRIRSIFHKSHQLLAAHLKRDLADLGY